MNRIPSDLRTCSARSVAWMATAATALLVASGNPASAVPTPSFPPPDLLVPFAVEGEPAAWARSTVPARLPPLERLRRLSWALLDTGGRPIADQPARTTTAAEVFRDRTANCVGYASLFVGLARELAVPVYFVLVDELPSVPAAAEGYDSLRVAEGHLAAAWGGPEAMRVFDLGGESDGRTLRARPITDLAAIAVFYSNHGVEALLEGRTADAVAWLRTAAELEPTALPSTWTNLGVALRRAGDLEAANLAYQRALELDPAAGTAYRNLAALLNVKGQSSEAANLLGIATALARLDSLAALHLARQRLREGNLQEARGLYRRALELSQRAPRR